LTEAARKLFLQLTAVVLSTTELSAAFAYETDQYTNRSDPIADSTEVLSEKVNETIGQIVALSFSHPLLFKTWLWIMRVVAPLAILGILVSGLR
jgi:hypothetical protein